MKQNRKNTAAVVRELIEPITDSLGYTLWSVEYVKEGSRYILRVTIDSSRGIDINDCEKVHRAIDAPLDEADPIEESYYLEVSSPGVERELTEDWHFEAFRGRDVQIFLFAPFAPAGGVKQLCGTLGEVTDKVLTLTVGENTYEIERERISAVREYYDFSKDTANTADEETNENENVNEE